MKIKEWLVSELGQDIWNKKYKFETESFDEWIERVSGGNKDVGKLIRDKKFLFGGRILANRGLNDKGRKVTYSNCYVLPKVSDSIESIFDTAKQLARTFSYGGGVGVDISKLAPRGAKLNNAAKETTGAVSFMDLYSLVTGLISQNGRRGALMLSIDCNHPDLEEFIQIKTDLNKVTKANISINITNEFMEAVKNGDNFELTFTREATGETTSKVIDARKIFRMIAEYNWDYAEPGFLLKDRIDSWNMVSEDQNFEYAGVNPCFTGDMRLLTVDGYKTFKELANSNVKLVNKDGNISQGKVWCSGEKEIYEISLANRQKITCTKDHVFMLNDGTECMAINLKNKRLMPYIDSDLIPDNEQRELLIKQSPLVVNVKSLNRNEPVYDFSEPLTHWGVVEEYIASNCAEEPLPAYGSCLLGSINLNEFIDNEFAESAIFKWNEFEETVSQVVIAMNEVLDEGLSLHPLNEQRECASNWRQIGIGIMGLADMLIKLRIKYGSKESLQICDKIGFAFINTAIRQSALLAKEYGTYPNYNEEAILSNPFLLANVSDETLELVKKYGLRNSQLLTTAPTGTLSTMLGISGGIEPIYNYGYKRKTESLHNKEVYYTVYTPIVGEYIERFNLASEADLPDFFTNAMELHYEDRILMQSVWQKHIDASISSTVNVPNSFTIEQVEDLYIKAWEHGLKGITIYRDGCKREGILQSLNDNKKDSKDSFEFDSITPVNRSNLGRTYGVTDKYETACGSLYLTINRDKDGNIVETFVHTSKNGTCKSNIDGLNRMISLCLRSGTKIEEIIDQLKSITCTACTRMKAKDNKQISGVSCPDIISRALENEYGKSEGKNNQKNEEKPDNVTVCTECNTQLSFSEGCSICPNCGHSKCA